MFEFSSIIPFNINIKVFIKLNFWWRGRRTEESINFSMKHLTSILVSSPQSELNKLNLGWNTSIEMGSTCPTSLLSSFSTLITRDQMTTRTCSACCIFLNIWVRLIVTILILKSSLMIQDTLSLLAESRVEQYSEVIF